MNGNVSKVLVLEGLCCANCATKIESQVKGLSGVRTASIDFITRRLTIEAEDKGQLNGIVVSATAIVKKIEPHVVVVEEKHGSAAAHDEHENHNHGEHAIEKKELLTLIAGCVLFAAALLLKSGGWVQLALFAVAYLVIGGDVLLQSIRNIIRGQIFDENFLMAIATIGAFVVGEYPEGVSVMLFYKLGELFQDMAVNRSRKSISSLMNIRPDYANLKEGDDIRKVSPEEVHIGSFILVKPGEKVPLDGKVSEGSSTVDTSALTGESVPKDVGVGDSVLAGFVNQSGLLHVQVTKEFGESTVAKILDLVQNASSKKAATEKFITKFARYYTPAVVFSAMALAVIPPVINGQGNFAEWLYRALVFLVVSCPCALVISIPLSFFGGIGGASHRGILIKGSSYLEALNNVDTVAFDKTGTLTKGIFKVTKVNVEEGFTEGQLLKIAALAESYSNHPIAQSIKTQYESSVKEAEVDSTDVENYKELPGLGVAARLSGMNIAVGNSRMMDKIQVPYKAVEDIGTVVYIAVDKKFAGSIVISDIIKEDSAVAVKALKAIGVNHVAMLTGDSAKIAENIGRQLGIDEIYAELLPDQKVGRIEDLEARKQKGGKLVFVGDGINDAPVLARADIGIAMGGLGSDAAIEAADIVIMNDEPLKIAEAIKIARKTRTIVWQNIIFALGVKAVVLVLGAIGFATMWEAVFADVGVALIAVINAMRAMKAE